MEEIYFDFYKQACESEYDEYEEYEPEYDEYDSEEIEEEDRYPTDGNFHQDITDAPF